MVFPLGDDNSDQRTFPIVNIALIVANILVFVFLQGMGNNENFTMAFSTVPAEIVTGQDKVTPNETIMVQSVDGIREVIRPGLQPTPVPVYLTILTSMFMHGSIAHLLGNMWFLWIFGDNIEQDMGRLRYLLFYVVSGILASLAHVAISMNDSSPSYLVPSLGASGAISGVMGGYLLLHPHRRVTVLLLRIVTEVPGFVAVGLWFVFQIFSSMMAGSTGGGVAYAAHIGGFIAGALLAKPFTLGMARPAARRPSVPSGRFPF